MRVLIHILPIICCMLFMLMLILLYKNKAAVGTYLRMNRVEKLIITIIIEISIITSVIFVPRHIYEIADEYEIISMGQNILYDAASCECFSGSQTACEDCKAVAWFPGYAFIISCIFFLLGTSYTILFATNILFIVLIGVLYYVIIRSLLKNKVAAAFGALMAILLPSTLLYSGTTSSILFSHGTILFSIAALQIFQRSKTTPSLMLFITASAISSYTRPENMLVISLLLLYLLSQKTSMKQGWISAGVLIILAMPLLALIAQLQFMPTDEFIEGYTFSLDITAQFMHNLFSFGMPHIFPLGISILAILGIIFAWKQHSKLRIVGFAFLLLLFVFSAYDQSDLTHPRFAKHTILLAMPLIVLASAAIAKLQKQKQFSLVVIACMLALASLFPAMAMITKTTLTLGEDHAFIETHLDAIPENAYIISYTPAIITSITDHRAISPSIFTEQMKESRFDDVYLLKGYLWDISFQRQGALTMTELRNEYTFSQVTSQNTTHPIVLYQLTRKT